MSYQSAPILRSHLLVLCVLLAVVTHLPHSVMAQEGGLSYVPGEVVIGWAPEDNGELARKGAPLLDEDRSTSEWQSARQALSARVGLQVADIQPGYGTALLVVPVGKEEAEIARLRQMPWVTYAEHNYVARAASDVAYPNDPFVGEQWHMRRIHAPETWAVTFGSSTVVVAVVDSGVDRYHPEFYQQFYDPLYPGWDYVNNDSEPNDDEGHGTHVTGLITAAANNGLGVAGLAPNVKVLPLKVLNSVGEGNFYNVAKAIRRATDFGAQVINLSLGGLVLYDEQVALQTAVDYAISHNALVVAAVGNCAQGGTYCGYANPTFYPAACNGVFAVAASDHFDNWSSYSNYNAYVSLAAPGGLYEDPILSTLPRSIVPAGYGYRYGTSMATSLVSAAAALVWTMQPLATSQEVADILKSTADKVGADPYDVNGRNNYFGYGRLNVGSAVRWAYPPSLTPVTETQRLLTDDPSQISIRAVTLANPSEQVVSWRAEVIHGSSWLYVDPTIRETTYSNPGSLLLRVGPAALLPGVYPGLVRVTAFSPAQISPIEIRVEWRIVSQLRRTHLSVITSNWYGAGWLDPFAAGAPTPQALPLTDNTAYPVSLPFPVTFYGRTYTAVWVSDNGLAWFGQGTSGAARPPAACLPSAAAPNNAIYVLALDWMPVSTSRIYAHRPNVDTFVITWHQVQRPWNVTPQSFQLIFHRTGEIVVSYRAIEALPPAVIGAENDDGTVAEQIFCNGVGSLPSSGDAFPLKAVLPWN